MLKDILPDIAFIVYHKDKNNNNSSTKIYNETDHRGIQIYIYDNNTFNAYDYKRKCYLNGTFNYIFDMNTKTIFNIIYGGIAFNGFDNKTKESFRGIINNNSITITINNTNEVFNFKIQ